MNKIPEVYHILKLDIQNGRAWFGRTGTTVVASDESEAIALAKKLGFDQPVLEKVDEPVSK